MTTDQAPNGTKRPGKPGPKPDQARAHMRRLFAEWSDRTFARYWKCHKRLTLLKEYGAIDNAGYENAIKAATRPNGSLNISKLERVTEDMAAMWIAQQDLDENDQDAA
jgi:hypothetical protein